jgi:tetratricopeptide (TPR) repeat protein
MMQRISSSSKNTAPTLRKTPRRVSPGDSGFPEGVALDKVGPRRLAALSRRSSPQTRRRTKTNGAAAIGFVRAAAGWRLQQDPRRQPNSLVSVETDYKYFFLPPRPAAYMGRVDRGQSCGVTMQCAMVFVLCAVGMGLSGVTAGQTRDENAARCKDANPDLSIIGCTALIQSGQEMTANLAIAFYNRGNAYGSKDQDGRAIQDYDQAIEHDPGYTQAFYSRGLAYARKGQYDRAIQDFNQTIALDPSFAHAFNDLGNAHERKGQYDRAIRAFDQAIKLDPSFAHAFYNRGNVYERKGQYYRALQDYDQTIRLEPASADHWNSRCWVRAIVEQLPQALADCNEALRRRPGDGDTLDSRGLVYLKMKNAAAAIADYDAVLQAHPKNASSLYGRGLAYRLKGDKAAGDADITVAKRIDPEIAKKYEGYGLRGS